MAKSYSSIKAGWKNSKSGEIGKKISYKDIKSSDYDFGVDENYINSFLTDAKNYIESYSSDYKTIGYDLASDLHSKYTSLGSDLQDRANTIRGYLNANKNNIDTENFDSFLSYLDDFKESSSGIRSTFVKAKDFYSNFKTEDEYNAFSWSNDYKEYSFNDLQKEITKLEKTKKNDGSEEDLKIGKKVDWLKTFSNNKDYSSTKEYNAALKNVDSQISALATEKSQIETRMAGYNRGHLQYTEAYKKDETRLAEINNQLTDLNKSKDNLSAGKRIKKREEDIAAYETNRSNPDFDALSVYGENLENASFDDFIEHYSKDTTGFSYEETEAFFDNQPRIENKVAFYFNNRDLLKNGRESITLLAGNGYVAPDLLLHGSTHYWDEMNEDEFSMYNCLLAKDKLNGTNEAETYLEKIEVVLGQRGYAKEKEATEEYYNEANLLGKIALNAASVPINLLGGAAAFVGDVGSLITTGEINPYSAAHNAQQGVSDVRQLTAEDIESRINNPLLAKLSSTTYQGLMSGADSLLGVATMGGAYTVTMGMGAASSKAKELYESGASNGQIITGSIVSGLIEYATEKVGIENLLKAKDLSTVKKILKSVAIQGVIEGSEEINSEILNMAADAIFQGYNSATEKEINYLILNCGLSEEEARNKVAVGNALNVFWAGYAGFVSGAAMSGGAYTLGIGKAAVDNKKEKNAEIKKAGTDIVSNENVENLVAIADTLPNTKANTKTKALANELKGVDVTTLSEKEQEAFSKKVGKLYSAIQEKQGTAVKSSLKDSAATIVKEKLAEKGITNEAEVKKATDIIIKVAYGNEALSFSEDKFMKKIGGTEIASYLINNENALVSKTNLTASERLGQLAETKSLTKDKNAEVRSINTEDYTFSDDGKTYIKSTDESVEITGVASIKDGDMKVNLSNGKTASLSELDLGSEAQAVIYEGILNMGIDAASAQAIANAFDFDSKDGITAKTYIMGMQDAVKYGKIGGKSFIDSGVFTSELNEKQREMGYEIGRITAENEAKKSAEKVKTSIKMNKKGDLKLGNVTFDGITEKDLDIKQKTTVKVFEQLFGNRGLNIVFFQSKVVNGKHVGENGSFDPKTNTIRLDINAGVQGNDTILFTAAHELTHFIRLWSADKFKVFADFLVESYAKHGVSIDALVEMQIEKAKRNNREIDYDTAYEEVVADSCETFLRDSKLLDRLIDLAKKDMTLFEKTQLYIANLLDDLRKCYNDYEPDSTEARIVLGWKDNIEQLHSLWEEAALSALDNSRAAGGRIIKNTTSEGDVKFALKEYSQHQKDNWKNSKRIVIYESEIQFRNFINEALQNKQYNKKIYFGAIPTDLASLIKSKTGLDVEGFNCSLSAYEIRKMFDDHGDETKEAPRGQRAITDDDIVNIPLVLQSPETIVRSPKDYMGKPVINMSKYIDGKMTIAAVVSDKHLDLFVQTAYVGIKKGNLVTPIAEQAAINTPKASSDTVSKDSIPQTSIKSQEKQSARENTIGERNLEDFAEAKDTDGNTLFQYRAMESDEDTYRKMLKTANIMNDTEIDALFDTVDKAMDIIKDNLEILDYAWETDIDDRAFSPVKKNTDKLYQVSVDFSTLCRKRLLQQTIQAHLQDALNRPLSKNEGIAIRDALMTIQEEGKKIEIACALCYVESARMKSPAQIKRFVDDRETVIKNHFAAKSDKVKAQLKDAEAKARKRLGADDTPLTKLPSKMQKEIRAAKKEVIASYVPSAKEQELIEIAKGMSVNDFVTPKGLENLIKQYPDLFEAYASYIVNATHSKGIENDTWWRAGDSNNIGDTLIANMNAENGLRSQSWSDFQVIHLLDYIAATIELSARKAKMQAYTKVPDFVELMGNTGEMINLSLIPTRHFNGALEFDSVEGMAFEESLRLRDKYHATTGTIAIGVDNVQIQMLLDSMDIDYVIPYHRSGMSKAVRKAMHIPTWDEYENHQSEKNLSREDARRQAKKYGVKLLAESDANYQKHPNFSDWFDIIEARQIAKMENSNPSDKALQKKYGVMYGGYMAMQNAANNYLKLCAERGISPKFSYEGKDFTVEDNYWKLLIDRKMVDNVTGAVIEQQAVKPIFDQGEVLRILNDELERYPTVKADQDYAIRKVAEHFLSGNIKGGMSAEAIAKAMKTPVDNIAKVNILASVEGDTKLSDRETYTRAKKYFGTTTDFEEAGFILPSGEMLRFTDDSHRGERQYDHRAIGAIYGVNVDFNVNHGFNDESTKHLVDFVEGGGIRFDPGSLEFNTDAGMQLSKSIPLTTAQEQTIRDFVEWKKQREENYNPDDDSLSLYEGPLALHVDFGGDASFAISSTAADLDAWGIKHLSYEGGQINADRIIADIRHYYRTGETRQPSKVAQFRYSDRDSEGNTLTKEQQEFFANSKVRDNKGRLIPVYHGTTANFNIFKKGDIGFHFGTKGAARGRVGYSKNVTIKECYLNITNPIVIDEDFGSWDADFELTKHLYHTGVLSKGEAESILLTDSKLYKRSTEDANKKLAEVLLSKGYDGIEYQNTFETKKPTKSYIAFSSNQAKLTTNTNPTTDPDIRYSERVTDEETLDFLNEQIEKGEYITVYRSFQVIDGGLYAPMNAVDRDENGKNKRLGYRSELGVWEKSTESPEIAQRYMDKHPNAKWASFDLDGVDNKTDAVAYNPYLHASNLVLNDQFAAAYRRNLVTVECRVPISEVGAYHAKYAKDTTGWVEWKPGGVAGKLMKVKPEYTRKLFVSRYMIPMRIIPDSEVANMYKEYLDGTDIAVPWNVVTPGLRKELVKAGVKISYKDVKGGNYTRVFSEIFPDDVNEGLRYQERDDDAAKKIEKINKQLAAENVKLIEDVKYLKELVKLQSKETHGKMLKKSTVELVAKRLMAYQSAKGNTSELVGYLTDVYNYIIQGDNVSWEGIQEKSQAAVDWLMNNEYHKPVREDDANEVLKHLRTMRVSLDEVQKAETAHMFGSYDNFRKKNMGRVIFANDAIPLDSVWQELADLFPGYFDRDVNSADQPIILMEIIDGLQNAYVEDEHHYYSDDIVRQDLMTKIYEGYWDVSALHTVADAKQKEINLLKAKHNERMEALRESHRESDAKLRQEHKAKITELRTQYREREERKIQKVAEYYQKSRKEAVDRVKENREKRDAITKLQKLVLDTAKWVSYPAKDAVKCPDIIRGPYAEFLKSIDLTSKRALNGGEPTKNDLRVASAMDSLAKAIEKKLGTQSPDTETDTVLDTGYLDLPVHFVENLKELAESLKQRMETDGHIVNSMTSDEIKALTKFIRTLNHSIKEMSTLYANMRFARVEQLGNDSMVFLKDLGEYKKSNSIVDFVTWDNALPYYTFKRFGVAGESVFEELMDAQDKHTYLAEKIFKFAENTWTGEEANEWSKDTHTIELPSGRKVTLTSADAMSIYCLSRREQGRQHLLGGGVRVLGIEKNGKKASDSRSLLNLQDLLAIADSLSERQRKVAESIQEFMSTVCSEWGNEISMKRFLTKEFTENFYFPIESNDENLDTKDPKAQQSDLYRLLNISATKPLVKGANNEVIIRNIFDVFASHSSDMAKLNAYGMALLDYMKWINYREKTVNDDGQISVSGVRKSMEKAYGPEAKKYVIGLIKDINGRYNDNGDNKFLMKMLRGAKTAMVGANLRVAALQVTAYPRAAMVLSSKSLTLGLTKVPQIEKAKKYCGIALRKSFGFYDTNISRSLEEQFKGATNIRQKLIELSLKGAEWGDAITWGALWNACEYEVAKTKKYKVGSEEFNQAVGKKLREVVYATQVVDSTLTRSQMMRSKSGLTQTASAFMSEPTLSANILMDAAFQFNLEKRRTGSAKVAWQKTSKYVGKAVAVYSVGQIFAALAEALMDAYRDDDEEEFKDKFGEAFKENAISDINPFNKIPIIADFSDLIMSWFGIGFSSSNSLYLQAIDEASNAFDTWSKVINGEDGKTVYSGIYSTTKLLSYITGVSGSGAMREVVTLWNNTAGAANPYLKIRTYESSATDKGIAEYSFDKGDTASVKTAVSKMVDDKVKSGKTEKEAKSSVRASFTSTYKAEYMAAVKAKDYDEMNRIRKFLYATGLYGTLSELDKTLESWRKAK